MPGSDCSHSFPVSCTDIRELLMGSPGYLTTVSSSRSGVPDSIFSIHQPNFGTPLSDQSGMILNESSLLVLKKIMRGSIFETMIGSLPIGAEGGSECSCSISWKESLLGS